MAPRPARRKSRRRAGRVILLAAVNSASAMPVAMPLMPAATAQAGAATAGAAAC
jgi:hypothetical protein